MSDWTEEAPSDGTLCVVETVGHILMVGRMGYGNRDELFFFSKRSDCEHVLPLYDILRYLPIPPPSEPCADGECASCKHRDTPRDNMPCFDCLLRTGWEPRASEPSASQPSAAEFREAFAEGHKVRREEHEALRPLVDGAPVSPAGSAAPDEAERFDIHLFREEGYGDDGWSATVPRCPGCFSQGTSRERAVANVLEALSNWWRADTKCGDDRPSEPCSTCGGSGYLERPSCMMPCPDCAPAAESAMIEDQGKAVLALLKMHEADRARLRKLVAEKCGCDEEALVEADVVMLAQQLALCCNREEVHDEDL